MTTDTACYHIGYFLNRRASWYQIKHFVSATELVRWLRTNANTIDGAIDFVSEG